MAKATVTDSDTPNNAATAQTPEWVADAALTRTGVTKTVSNPVNTTVANFTDADPNGTVGHYTATINWG
ncbi:MAG TPA: hypothetical protein VHT75_18450 [Acidimicrobiales bacterium]|nr:hypothetical protein [Acidimicrobiales bacterium]